MYDKLDVTMKAHKHCNLTQIGVFQECLPIWIKFVCFAHIPIPTCWFWRGVSVKIIWIWHTAIVIAKNDQKWWFLGMISALNKICVFCAKPFPTFSFYTFMNCNIILIWRTAIVITKNHKNGGFPGTISALNKICVFCAYLHPVGDNVYNLN